VVAKGGMTTVPLHSLQRTFVAVTVSGIPP
jgi:hypothetical protein